MNVYTFNSEYPYGSNMYVLESCGQWAIIDPSASYLHIKSLLKILPKDIKYILLTHGHFDHILYLDNWCEITGLLPSVSSADALMISDATLNCYRQFLGIDKTFSGEVNIIKNGEVLKLGEEHINVMSVPGHTLGSLAFITQEVIFTGDTVFANGGIGRCDLPTGDFSMLLTSVEKIKLLNKDLTVYPGHGYITKISKI